MRRRYGAMLSILLIGLAIGCAHGPRIVWYDVLIRNGTIYDGSGAAPFVGDVAIRGDTIAAVGRLDHARARVEIDATGLAVSPGFINMLSWATESLIHDGRALSDIRQGVTLEVFGEGWSMGPLNDRMKEELKRRQRHIRYEIRWTTLGEYLEYLERKGIAPNVASFVGATTVRIYVLGYADRDPTPAELQRMQQLVREAMEEGALGVGASLIYPPAFYASTEELIALARVAAAYGGMFIAHIRSEGDHLLEAVQELIRIAREAGIRAEIYHLKAAGRTNWDKLDRVIAMIEQARADGLAITADMYTYTAAATGLSAIFPPWVYEGGHEAMIRRLHDPAIRARLKREILAGTGDWENLYRLAGPENILLVGFKQERLQPLVGKTLAEVARMRGTDPIETAMHLIAEDNSRIEAIYFLMSEKNVRKKIALPWVSFGSDAPAPAPEGVFLRDQVHPRAYGNFARLLGKYVREERVISLEEAIRRLTSLPATNLRLHRRGFLRAGYYADIAVFDPRTIRDHATFAQPHRLATGVVHLFVNGQQVLRNGRFTGVYPGRFIRGPGWRGRNTR